MAKEILSCWKLGFEYGNVFCGMKDELALSGYRNGYYTHYLLLSVQKLFHFCLKSANNAGAASGGFWNAALHESGGVGSESWLACSATERHGDPGSLHHAYSQ